MKKENAKTLITDINAQRDAWNERSQFTLHGVTNLSQSDLDVLELYCEDVIENGNINSFMRPLGDIAKILEKAGVL